MSRRRSSSSSSMAAAVMPLDEFEPWLQARAEQHPVATSLPMLDGYVAAIVAGPVSISPLDWICPLLAIDADAFNHGGTPEFAAISAVALRQTTSVIFFPLHHIGSRQSMVASRMATLMRGRGVRDSMPPCSCDYRRGPHCSTSATYTTACSCLSCCIASTIKGVHCLDRQAKAARPRNSCATPMPTFRTSSRPCVSTGCRPATLAHADHCRRGSSYLLQLILRHICITDD